MGRVVAEAFAADLRGLDVDLGAVVADYYAAGEAQGPARRRRGRREVSGSWRSSVTHRRTRIIPGGPSCVSTRAFVTRHVRGGGGVPEWFGPENASPGEVPVPCVVIGRRGTSAPRRTDRDGARCARVRSPAPDGTVERRRITANAARVSWRAELVYSWRGERWSLERPVCPGEVTAARRTPARRNRRDLRRLGAVPRDPPGTPPGAALSPPGPVVFLRPSPRSRVFRPRTPARWPWRSGCDPPCPGAGRGGRDGVRGSTRRP